MSINRVCISGNLTRNADLRYSASGMPILGFGIAVNDRRKNNQTGAWEDYTNYADCTMFGNRAQSVYEYLIKGCKVFLEGKLRWSQWNRNGQKHSKIEVIVDDLEFISRNVHTQQRTPVQQAHQQPMPVQQAPQQAAPHQAMPVQQAAPVASYPNNPVVDASIYDTEIPF